MASGQPSFGCSGDDDGGSGGGSAVTLGDFKQLSLLGEGAYSAVYKVLRLADHEIYALKKVKLPSLSDKEKQNALNEIRLLASIQHENVIAYKEAFFDDKTRCLCIVQECADAGDLLQLINKCKQERSYLREIDIWRYLVGMCRGLKTLHDLRILHRDMKCANIFLSKSSQGTIAKLGDFNVSKVAKRGLCMTQTGTPYYASPEVWRDMPYDAKSDMWSLGCVLYEMVALRPPFRAEDMEGLYRKVVRGQYPRIPAHYSQDLTEVIAALLQVHPRHRPSIDQLLEMPAMLGNAPGLKPNEEHSRPSDLLQTIKLPKNAIDLTGCLPKARYGMERMDSIPSEGPESPAGSTHAALLAGRRPPRGHGAAERGGGTPTTELSGAAPPPPPLLERGAGDWSPGGRYASAEAASEVEGAGMPNRGGAAQQQQPPAASALEGDSLDAYLMERSEPPAQEQCQNAGHQQGSRQAAAALTGTGSTQAQQQARYRPDAGGALRPVGSQGRQGSAGSMQPPGPAGNGNERGSDKGSAAASCAQGPSHNARYGAPQAYVAPAAVAGAAASRPPRALEPRRPMSIYARQQYAVVEQSQAKPASPAPPEASKNPPGNESSRRSRRSLIARLF